MQIVTEVPDDLMLHADPAREALEAFAIAGYRTGALSYEQTRMLLGFSTGYELDGFLKRNKVSEFAYDLENLEQDRQFWKDPA